MLGDCPIIHIGRVHELFRRVIQHIRLGGLSNILPKLGSVFSRTKNFCFENWLFYSHIGLGVCEGVGEDSGHEIGHLDIRVSSCNCLNVFVCHACALGWGVTYVGNDLYWALLTLSRAHHFRYRERSGRRHSLEAV